MTPARWLPITLFICASFLAGCSGPSADKPGAAEKGTEKGDKEADIRANLAKLDTEDRKLAEAQRFCAVENENRLGSMGTPVKVMVNDQPVFLCCKGCRKKALADPEKTLARVKELKAKSAGLLRGALEANRAVDGGEGAAINSGTTVPVPEGGSPVAARTDAEGTIHLLYNSADGPKYAKSSNNGNTFEPPIPVVDEASRKPGLVFEGWDMAVGKGNRVHVAMGTNAWKLKLPEKEWGFYYTSLDPGAKAFAPVRNINGTPSEGFSLAADDKGTVAACWLSGKLYANVSHDGGKTFGPRLEIDPAYDPCNCCTTSTVFGADGKLAVLYREETNNERDMWLVLWDQGRSQASRTRISTTLWKIDACPMTYYTVSRNGDGFKAVWPTKGEIYFARLDGKGKLLPPGEIKTAGKSGMRTGMLALNAANGSTLVAWRQDDSVKWQLYDAKGQPSGSVGSAKSAGTGVAGVVDKSGHFILFR
jgi:hypothetical protein